MTENEPMKTSPGRQTNNTTFTPVGELSSRQKQLVMIWDKIFATPYHEGSFKSKFLQRICRKTIPRCDNQQAKGRVNSSHGYIREHQASSVTSRAEHRCLVLCRWCSSRSNVLQHSTASGVLLLLCNMPTAGIHLYYCTHSYNTVNEGLNSATIKSDRAAMTNVPLTTQHTFPNTGRQKSWHRRLHC